MQAGRRRVVKLGYIFTTLWKFHKHQIAMHTLFIKTSPRLPQRALCSFECKRQRMSSWEYPVVGEIVSGRGTLNGPCICRVIINAATNKATHDKNRDESIRLRHTGPTASSKMQKLQRNPTNVTPGECVQSRLPRDRRTTAWSHLFGVHLLGRSWKSARISLVGRQL